MYIYYNCLNFTSSLSTLISLQAMNMSFKAVLGVADNISKMRTAVFEFLSAFAVLKIIYSFYRRILYFFGAYLILTFFMANFKVVYYINKPSN